MEIINYCFDYLFFRSSGVLFAWQITVCSVRYFNYQEIEFIFVWLIGGLC